MSNAIARKIESIEVKGALNSADVAKILGARPETVSRWNQGKTYPQRSAERILLDLEFITDLLADVYEPQDARVWLQSRQRVLGGETPIKLIKEDRTGEILKVLHQFMDGTYV